MTKAYDYWDAERENAVVALFNIIRENDRDRYKGGGWLPFLHVDAALSLARKQIEERDMAIKAVEAAFGGCDEIKSLVRAAIAAELKSR